MAVELIGIPSERLDDVWDAAEELLYDALEGNNGEITTFDCYEGIKAKRLQLWLVYDGSIRAAVVTELAIYPRKKVCRVLQLSGKGMDEWLHLTSVIEAWAKENGARGMELVGRKGWERHMKQHGYGFEYLVLSKEL